MKSTNRVMQALVGSTLVIGLLGAPLSALAAEKSKMVIQVSDNDPKKWQLAMGNAKNIQKDLGKENVDLEIITYGPGIMMLKAHSKADKGVSEMINSGVKVVACENTMAKEKLKKADMLPVVGYVPSGVVEILKKQEAGYAYLRP